MALLINFLDALGALLLLGIAYQRLPITAPGATLFASFIALIFFVMSYVLREVAYERFPPKKSLASIGVVLVFAILLIGAYFYVPLWQETVKPFQIISMVWLPVVAILVLVESILSLKRHF